MSQHETIQTLLQETRTFSPDPAFAAGSNASDPEIYERAAKDPEAWWDSWAKKLDWFEPYHTVCEFEAPNAKWFLGGKLNATYNCVDRHAATQPKKRAIVWEGEPGDVRIFNYGELKDEVSRLANALKSLGVGKGDRVCVYMPMVPELAFIMLACARIGAPHTVVFGGFSAESLQERANDASVKLIVTADGGWRRGGVVPLKAIVDEAMERGCPTVEKVLVLDRITSGGTTPPPSWKAPGWTEGRDIWWHDLVPQQSTDCPCEPMDSEDLLYILYTSGSTGKPKGIVHTTGGYMTGVYATTQLAFDLKEDDLHFCTADCGWVTGHSYIVYGPLANGATVLMYEGAPDTPEKDRFWRIIERHKATILYTAPTAIRAFMKWGDEYPNRCNLSSLRLLGSVGEPINPEAWIWYQQTIGKGRCPVIDTWWQTETGGIMITALPGITATKPGSATHPFPGIKVSVYSEDGSGETVTGPNSPGGGHGKGGFLVLEQPWPSMTRGIFNDPERFVKTYWSRFPGKYFAGDGVKLDDDGYLWLLGRVDDIMLVAGHNISTMEVESALVDHPSVAEAAVIGKTHDVKGQAISAFVILRGGVEQKPGLVDELKAHVAHKIGAIARPDDVFITAELPKTRSGKIMRRLLRDVAEGRALGDTTTLADPTVVAALKDKYEGQES
ncbi:MAG TPA: acetate--CoA ligase [Fimbriimonas sp.]|nr:acetate--CoA ligase [Fimbriimonas sp.]